MLYNYKNIHPGYIWNWLYTPWLYLIKPRLSFAELCKLVKNGCSISHSSNGTYGDKNIGDQYWLFLKHKSVVKENGKSKRLQKRLHV